MSRHPVFTFFLGWFFGAVSTCIGLEDSWLVPGIIIQSVILLFVLLTAGRDMRKVGVIVVLIGSILASPGQGTYENEQPEGKPAATNPCLWRAVGTVVIAVGGYITVKITKFCQKHFGKDAKKKKDNQTNEAFTATSPFALDEDTYAAAFNWGALGSCPMEDACYEDLAPAAGRSFIGVGDSGFCVTLEISLKENPDGTPAFTHRFSTSSGTNAVQTFSEYQAEIARTYGVFPTGSCCENFFTRNGSPISQGQSPIRCDPGTMNLKFGGGMPYRVTVECSRDLKFWDPILQIESPPGVTLAVEDASGKRAVFYRYRAVPAW